MIMPSATQYAWKWHSTDATTQYAWKWHCNRDMTYTVIKIINYTYWRGQMCAKTSTAYTERSTRYSKCRVSVLVGKKFYDEVTMDGVGGWFCKVSYQNLRHGKYRWHASEGDAEKPSLAPQKVQRRRRQAAAQQQHVWLEDSWLHEEVQALESWAIQIMLRPACSDRKEGVVRPEHTARSQPEAHDVVSSEKKKSQPCPRS